MSRPPAGRLAGCVAALAVTVGSAGACTRATDEFCEALSSRRDLEGLSGAITRRDEPAIRREMADLRILERTAPPALLDDVREVLDTLTETVRAVTEVSTDEADATPIDPAILGDRLARVRPAAQRLEQFADENCRVDL